MHGQVRRRVYLAICVLGLVGCGWQIAGAEGHLLERTVSFPLLAAFLLGAGVVLVRFPSRIRWVEVGGFVVLAAVWLTTMALQLATAPDDATAWSSLFPACSPTSACSSCSRTCGSTPAGR